MKEEEIRKRNIFNKYLELVEIDIKEFFDFNTFVKIPCPACFCSDFKFEFNKHGFDYVSCKKCFTLYGNPRPTFKNLKSFYANSPSTSFWIEKFFKPVAESRRVKIFKPRAEYISKTLPELSEGQIGDIGSGFGLFLEEIAKFFPHVKSIAIEPSPRQAEICRSKGLHVLCCALEEVKNLEGKFDLFTAFELFEHLYDPYDFLNRVKVLLKPGGYFLMTTLNARGFDIQLLWEKSKSVFPPHHLNFFNPTSIRNLLKRLDFEIVEISTPGKLDWDIVEGMILKENIHINRFWHMLAGNDNQEVKEALQKWITNNNLSSHMRILVKKPRASVISQLA